MQSRYTKLGSSRTSVFGAIIPYLYFIVIGVIAFKSSKAPLLKFMRHVPLVHVPSGKMQIGGKVPSYSIKVVLWFRISMTFCFSSGVPARGTNRHPIIDAILPSPGVFFMKAPAMNEMSPSMATMRLLGSKQLTCGAIYFGTRPFGPILLGAFL